MECGPGVEGRRLGFNFSSAYYLYAIIFLIFDVENGLFTVTLAVAFTGLGVAACVSNDGFCAAAGGRFGVEALEAKCGVLTWA